jgi:hypothetical protein
VVYFRPDKPPRQLLDSLGVPKGAKILVSAALKQDDTWLVATTWGLAIARGEERQFHPWDHIDRASLKKRGSLLSITYTGQVEPEEFTIQPKDKRFASILNERIKASVIEVEHVKVPGGQVIVALRRRPQDQKVYLQEVPEPGIDQAAAAPLIRAARHRLAEAAGLPRGEW